MCEDKHEGQGAPADVIAHFGRKIDSPNQYNGWHLTLPFVTKQILDYLDPMTFITLGKMFLAFWYNVQKISW